MRTVLIVGGGASGALMAVQLLKQSKTCKVVLFERRPEIGAGIAYGTENPHHLLNVPALGMSAFADEPHHFVNWLVDQTKWKPAEGWSRRSFAPRRLYRDYLNSLLASHVTTTSGETRFCVVRDEVVDLVETGAGVVLTTQGGGRHSGDIAILAAGNEGPGLPPQRRRFDSWSSPAGFDIPQDASVAIIGTGLSMVDAVISLLDAGHTGPLAAISRRGLLPQPQAGTEACPLDAAEIPFGVSLSKLSLWLRRRVRQKKIDDLMDWRCVIDGLRPHSQEIWRQLSDADRRRFLRHARPWWDIHRHRMAPQIRARIDAAIASGQFAIYSGGIRAIDYCDAGVRLRFRRRGTSAEMTQTPDYVIECRGQNTDVGKTRNAALRSLFDRGAIRADSHRLGVDVDEDCTVIDAKGQAARRLFAIGPMTLGTFWEIVAVPDIRRQTAKLAAHLISTIDAHAPSSGSLELS